MPGTAGGTPRERAVTVAVAISCDLYNQTSLGDKRVLLVLVALSRRDHVRLEKSSLEEDVMIGQSFVLVGEHRISDLLAAGDIVLAVGKDLWLDDGYKTVLRFVNTAQLTLLTCWQMDA